MSESKLVRCPECVAEGERSRVSIHGTTSTLMASYPYYDEDGIYHHHDPNKQSTGYSCSRGHSWRETLPRLCPARGCSWRMS